MTVLRFVVHVGSHVPPKNCDFSMLGSAVSVTSFVLACFIQAELFTFHLFCSGASGLALLPLGAIASLDPAPIFRRAHLRPPVIGCADLNAAHPCTRPYLPSTLTKHSISEIRDSCHICLEQLKFAFS